jgi:ribonuclease Z
MEVKAELCDHRIPALIYRATETQSFLVDETRIERLGLIMGDWLRVLKKRFYGGTLDQGPLKVLRRHGDRVVEELVEYPSALYEAIRGEVVPSSIGYITDIGPSHENLEKVFTLMEGVTLLVCECAFLAKERGKAQNSSHLSTIDLNHIVERLRPPFILPMHLSNSYSGKSHLLYEELKIPPGVVLLRLPEQLTPRPLLPGEIPKPGAG